jgi:hypothetical protein
MSRKYLNKLSTIGKYSSFRMALGIPPLTVIFAIENDYQPMFHPAYPQPWN